MKKFQVLAGIVSTVAIAGSIAFGEAASAETCLYNKSRAAKSGFGTTLVGSGGEAQMNPCKSYYKAIALGCLGLAGVLGGGAGYMSYRVGKRASAACAAMSDNFEVFEESIAPIAENGVSEYLEVPGELDFAEDAVREPNVAVTESAEAVAVVREHPEAPGGELDLPVVEVVELLSPKH